MSASKIEARCILKHKFVMTVSQIRDAQSLGAAICPVCGNVAVVQRVTFKKSRRTKKRTGD